jgi:putative inorganic carbon (HCO3(-)) transporter
MHFGFSTYGPLFIYVGAIASFVLSVVWRPQIGMYFLVPLLPMQTARYWVHEFPVGEKLVDVLLLGVVIGLIIHTKSPRFLPSPLNRVLIIFFAVTYFALWEGSFFVHAPLPLALDDPRFSDWKNYVEMMLIFFIAASAIRTPKQMTLIISLMLLSVIVVNRNYHSTIGGRDLSQYSDSLREAGTLGYAGENGMGAFQSEMAVFFIGLACFVKKTIPRIVLWGVAMSSVYCLLLTFSRGGYLGFLMGLLVLGIIRERKLLIVLAILLVTWQSLVPNAVRERVLMTYQQGEGLDASAEERVTIWQDAVDVITRNPLLGTGFDTYAYMGRVGDYKDTHNYYLKVFLELGFIGLAVFLWALLTIGKMTWQLFKRSEDRWLSGLAGAFFAMLFCAVVVNFFGDRWTYLQVNGFFWVLVGLVCRALFILKEQQTEGEAFSAEAGALNVPMEAAAPRL